MFASPKVFINYRRSDASPEALLLNNSLESAFGKGFAFLDSDDIEPGKKWVDALHDAGESAKVIITVIGPDWLTADKNGRRRIDDPDDWVRKEIALAIDQDKTIIPITVKGAKVPNSDDLPDEIRGLLGHQAFDIRTDRWNHDMVPLVKQISKITSTPLKGNGMSKWVKLLALLVVIAGSYFIYTQTKAKPFCPDFRLDSSVKTLIYPFSKENNTSSQLEELLTLKIDRSLSTHGITGDIGKPNVTEDRFYELSEAKQSCKTCGQDIVLTGIATQNNDGSMGIEADLGLCNSTYNGLTLDEEKLQISSTIINLSDLSSDPNIEESLNYLIQFFLGVLSAQQGQYEKSLEILLKTADEIEDKKSLLQEVYKVIWHNQYRLDLKEACIGTLGRLRKLNTAKLKTIATQAVVEFEIMQYHNAIENLSLVIEGTNQTAKKERFIEKRGDAYAETEQFQKARSDYTRIQRTPTVGDKIIKVDDRIRLNDTKINDLKARNNLTDFQRANLSKLLYQNGRLSESANTLQAVNFNLLTQAQKNRINLDQNVLKIIRSARLTY